MGADTKIEWATHTFNPWVGCAKLSPACTNCYAESWAKRTGQADLWRGERRRTSASNWRKPLQWNRETPGAKVFCSSLADVFEDHKALSSIRADLWPLIERCSSLVWLLLSKRPEHVRAMVPTAWLERWPSHVWLGCTVEDQQRANERIPHLLEVPAPVRFLSMEPLLGRVDLTAIVSTNADGHAVTIDALTGEYEWESGCGGTCPGGGVQWVISGGESGPKARPSHPDWLRSLRDQCTAVGVAFHFKQHGEWLPIDRPWEQESPQSLAQNERWMNLEGGHGFHGEEVWRMRRVGKVAAGRELDGRTWDEVPHER